MLLKLIGSDFLFLMTKTTNGSLKSQNEDDEDYVSAHS